MRISDFSASLKYIDEVWYSEKVEGVSYPDDGSSIFFGVESRSLWFLNRNKLISEVVKEFLPSGPVFDIGGGNGFVSKAFLKQGLEYVLVEPSVDAVINAKKTGLKNIICSSFDNAGFLDNSLPAVGLFDVIEHIEDDVCFLKKISRALSVGGKLYLTVPTCNFLWSTFDVHFGHFRRYRIEEIIKKIEAVGLEVEFSSYFFFFFVFPIFLTRTIPSFFYRKSIKSSEGHVKQHNSGIILKKIVNFLFSAEIYFIKRKKNIPLGSSCIIVATKK
jgi:SAM-dependent methyltransferase